MTGELRVVAIINTYSSLALFDFCRSCCGSLEGHESTVWAAAFEPPDGNRIGKIPDVKIMILVASLGCFITV